MTPNELAEQLVKARYERDWHEVVKVESSLRALPDLTGEVERLKAELDRLNNFLGPITWCRKCKGNGKDGVDRTEYPAGACCPIGHAHECGCLVCLWRRAGHVKATRIAELEAKLGTAELPPQCPLCHCVLRNTEPRCLCGSQAGHPHE